jgi:deoxyribonuclease V
MTSPYAHAWDVTEAKAMEIQSRLRPLVQRSNGFELSQIKTVAGIDCSLKEEGLAAIVVLSYPDLEIVDQALAIRKITFPYVPGFLSFREAPVILEAMERLKVEPDLLMLDGQGIAHPRRFGIACHVGLVLDKPSIGCAKSVLVGRYTTLGEEVGDEAPMLDRGEVVAMALRTRKGSKPMIISSGHKIDLATSVMLVKNCLRGYRLPETTRLADKYSRVGDDEPLIETPKAKTNPKPNKTNSKNAEQSMQDTMF